MNKNPLIELNEYGQSFWLDNINRPLITSGELKRLVEEDGLRGVTSNPTIFEKAITESDAYDEEFAQAVKESESFEVAAVTAALTTSDIKQGCDILRPVFDESGGYDGYVCLEVSPDLAADTEGTIKEAVELHKRVNRQNLMIKVPATPEGIPVIEELINRGICVNVTLMFALVHVPQYYPSFSTIFLLTILSLTLTAIRVKAKNLLPCIILHTLFNGLQSVLLILEPMLKTPEVQEQTATIIRFLR